MQVAGVSYTQLVLQPKNISFKCNSQKPEIKSSQLRGEEIEMHKRLVGGKCGRGTREGKGGKYNPDTF